MSLNLGKAFMSKMKTSFRLSKFGTVPSFEETSKYINQEILPLKYEEVYDLEDEELIGMKFPLKPFMENHMRRFIRSQVNPFCGIISFSMYFKSSPYLN